MGAEFLRGPWFPLVCVLVVIVIIVGVLLASGTVTGLPAVLSALAGVLAALGGLVAAAAKFRR